MLPPAVHAQKLVQGRCGDRTSHMWMYVSALQVDTSGAPSKGDQHRELTGRLWPDSAMMGLWTAARQMNVIWSDVDAK